MPRVPCARPTQQISFHAKSCCFVFCTEPGAWYIMVHDQSHKGPVGQAYPSQREGTRTLQRKLHSDHPRPATSYCPPTPPPPVHAPGRHHTSSSAASLSSFCSSERLPTSSTSRPGDSGRGRGSADATAARVAAGFEEGAGFGAVVRGDVTAVVRGDVTAVVRGDVTDVVRGDVTAVVRGDVTDLGVGLGDTGEGLGPPVLGEVPGLATAGGARPPGLAARGGVGLVGRAAGPGVGVGGPGALEGAGAGSGSRFKGAGSGTAGAGSGTAGAGSGTAGAGSGTAGAGSGTAGAESV